MSVQKCSGTLLGAVTAAWLRVSWALVLEGARTQVVSQPSLLPF